MDVLAYASEVRVWTPGVRYAAELAASVGATLTGLYVAPPWPAREPSGAPPSVMAELLACAQEDVRAALQAGTRFGAWARELGVASASWHVALGDAAEVLGIAGNWSDLIVVDRRIGDRDGTSDLIGETLLAGYVCLAVPDNRYALARFDRVFVAFDRTPTAIRALHAALPLIERAERVIVLAFDGDGRSDTVSPLSFDPVRWLELRGIGVEVDASALDGDVSGATLLAASARHRADLLVSGARGKLRLDECRLDPVAQHLLAYSEIPLLMAR
jgi:nucleotide-binding universal stress UspA family protein